MDDEERHRDDTDYQSARPPARTPWGGIGLPQMITGAVLINSETGEMVPFGDGVQLHPDFPPPPALSRQATEELDHAEFDFYRSRAMATPTIRRLLRQDTEDSDEPTELDAQSEQYTYTYIGRDTDGYPLFVYHRVGATVGPSIVAELRDTIHPLDLQSPAAAPLTRSASQPLSNVLPNIQDPESG